MSTLPSKKFRGLFIAGIVTSAVVISGCAQMAAPGSLGGLSGATGALGVLGGSQTADAGKISAAIVVSLISLTEALEQYNRAIGNAEKADEAKGNAEGLRSGARAPDEAINVIADLSKSFNAKVEELNASGAQLSDASKEHLAKGLALHAIGTVAGVKAAVDLVGAIKSPSPATLSALAGVAGFPPMLSTWAETTSAVMKFAQRQGLDTSEFAGKISESAAMKLN